MFKTIFTSPIYSVSEDGSGVARLDGYTVFVKGAVIGDECKIEITKRNKTYGFGKLLEIVTPSSSRIEPVCPQFKDCGGCTLLHTDYDTQLKIKRETVYNALTRIGGFENIFVHETTPSVPNFNYRNKSQYPVGGSSDNVKIGFYAPRSHNVINSNSCAIENPDARLILNAFRLWMKKYHIAPYNEEKHTGTIRHIYSRAGESIMVVIVSRTREIDQLDKLKDMLLNLGLSKPIGGIVVNINSQKTNTILGKYDYTLYGEKFIYAQIDNITYKVNYKSFFQVNPYTTNLLYKKALELCSLTGKETVFDLYCGIGTISLFLAQNAKKVIGVEIVPEAIEDARENARLNNIENVEFYCGAAETVCPPLIKAGEKADVVVVDPPRKGCDEALLNAIGKMKPDKIVYVSCNVATLARDAKILHEKYGYEMKEAFPFDQFPHSTHIECVALLTQPICVEVI
ncbi:MAG: 23S rRNA (uracil(1939)-C(5))-methyltransferase RlmD [Clostridia bacterium]|nr:23S rRNA (uracil(1939)-C(5))-methyltransferase RlmD [Clostridia bacterium]